MTDENSSSTKNYHAFLLRLWQEKNRTGWRASTENPRTGERKGFGSLRELVEFLEAQTGEKISSDSDNFI